MENMKNMEKNEIKITYYLPAFNSAISNDLILYRNAHTYTASYLERVASYFT
jgi:hypothetical protein